MLWTLDTTLDLNKNYDMNYGTEWVVIFQEQCHAFSAYDKMPNFCSQMLFLFTLRITAERHDRTTPFVSN
jgi:hypothetical protein